MENMTVKPIGVVRSEVKEKQEPGFDWWKIESEIRVDPKLADGLHSIEEFSHLMIICWMDRATDPAKMVLKVHPRGRHDLPPVGVFTSRSPYRPNPLGKTTVKLLEHNGNIIKVKGLDAIDGTPVIDIKPYIPDYDSAPNATAPKWTQHHRPEH